VQRELAVKETASLTGLSPYTLRYYERIGLLGPVGRSELGHRRYNEGDLAWIEFLNRLRSTGMPVSIMKEFADLRRWGSQSVPERRALLEAHGRVVKSRISKLERDLAVIDEKIRLYKFLEVGNDADRRPGEEQVREGTGEVTGG
jgi:DNA-binding transcriptional MerR regulator